MEQRLLTRSGDNFAMIRQLTKLKVGVTAVGFLESGRFFTFKDGLARGMVDYYPLVVEFRNQVRLEQRRVYYNTRFAACFPDVVPEIPYIHQWEILTLIYA